MLETIDEVLEAMKQHSKENPKHGINCACKDRWIGNARQLIDSKDLRRELNYLKSAIRI